MPKAVPRPGLNDLTQKAEARLQHEEWQTDTLVAIAQEQITRASARVVSASLQPTTPLQDAEDAAADVVGMVYVLLEQARKLRQG